eukprot:436690-Rhodomonas_salina.1
MSTSKFRALCSSVLSTPKTALDERGTLSVSCRACVKYRKASSTRRSSEWMIAKRHCVSAGKSVWCGT